MRSGSVRPGKAVKDRIGWARIGGHGWLSNGAERRGKLENDEWQMRVRNLLSAGFGSEDIAILTDESLKAVREEIKSLREDGTLKEIYLRGKNARRQKKQTLVIADDRPKDEQD